MGNLGNIKIADDVVRTIAAKATEDVDGVYKLAGGVAGEVSKMLGKKRTTTGIKVEVGEKNLLQIICGAKNARKGLKVAYAPIGCTIP
ncbi:MAG: Asp23/Gls24 family envelope stress response protein, partial [Fusobacterium sp.]